MGCSKRSFLKLLCVILCKFRSKNARKCMFKQSGAGVICTPSEPSLPHPSVSPHFHPKTKRTMVVKWDLFVGQLNQMQRAKQTILNQRREGKPKQFSTQPDKSASQQ